MQWKIDFSAFKGAKYTIIFPVTAEPYAPQDRIDGFSPSPLPMSEVLNNNNNDQQSPDINKLADEIEEEFKQKFDHSARGGDQPSDTSRVKNESLIIVPPKEAPMFQKSTCCGQVLLLSMKELVSTFEEHIGLRCDEAYLEDSAIRFLKDSFIAKKCSCGTYKFIFVDLDDPTINLKRFMTTVTQLCKENQKSITVYGCSQSEARGKP